MKKQPIYKSLAFGLLAVGLLGAGMLSGCGASSDDNPPFGVTTIPSPSASASAPPITTPISQVGITSFRVLDALPGDLDESVAAVGVVNTAGENGTGTFSVTGLPDGVAASFDTPTITLPTASGTAQVAVTLTTTKNVFASGTYPIRLVLTVNGRTYTSAPTNLVVKEIVAF